MKRERLKMLREPKAIDKASLLIVLMMEARSERMWTNTAVKRVVKACYKFALSNEELWRVLQYLDIADYKTGTPYQKSIVRTWP